MLCKPTIALWISLVAFMSNDVLADDDRELALAALIEIGADVPGTTGRCSNCHMLSPRAIMRWGDRIVDTTQCLKRGDVSERMKCVMPNTDISEGEVRYSRSRMGFWTAKPSSPEFERLFREYYSPERFRTAFDDFLKKTSMPPNANHRMSDEGFAKVQAWAEKGMPYLKEFLPEPPAPELCVESVSEELHNHVKAMKTQGWGARNSENMLSMAGCTDSNPRNCLKNFPDAKLQSYSKDWATQSPSYNFRVLVPDTEMFYWIRSSPDGRFVGTAARIHDLGSRTQGARTIALPRGYIDPAFSPDSSMFTFSSEANGPMFCPLHLLRSPNLTSLNPGLAPCRSFKEEYYMYLGASLSGSYQLALSGSFSGDSGDFSYDVPVEFEARSQLRAYVLSPMSASFDKYSPFEIPTPFTGDWGLSPSGILAIGRQYHQEQLNNHNGYVLNIVDLRRDRDGFHLALKPAGMICARGSKASFSYDERFLVTHHSVAEDEFRDYGFANSNDPKFQNMIEKGTKNVFLFDLLTGRKYRITTMQPGQRAMFPHFRSDGWLYFAIHDVNLKKKYIVGTDAALTL